MARVCSSCAGANIYRWRVLPWLGTSPLLFLMRLRRNGYLFLRMLCRVAAAFAFGRTARNKRKFTAHWSRRIMREPRIKPTLTSTPPAVGVGPSRLLAFYFLWALLDRQPSGIPHFASVNRKSLLPFSLFSFLCHVSMPSLYSGRELNVVAF